MACLDWKSQQKSSTTIHDHIKNRTWPTANEVVVVGFV